MEALLPSVTPTEAKPDELPDLATRRMAALDSKQKKHDATLKQIQHLAQFEKPAQAFQADPIAFMVKAGMSEDQIGQVVVAALQKIGAKVEGAPDAKPDATAKPQEPAKDEPAQLSPEESAALTAKGVAFSEEVATSLGDKADLVRGAAADGFKVKLKGEGGQPDREVSVYEYALHEIERRYAEAVEAGHLPPKGLTRAQYRALDAEVLADMNRALEKNADLVRKHRTPKPAPADAEEKETPGALTSAISGAGGEGPKTFRTEAEWRAARLARIASLPQTQAVRRGR